MTQNDNETKLYSWLDSCPFDFFADEDELGNINVRFILPDDNTEDDE